jgi:glycerate kinase
MNHSVVIAPDSFKGTASASEVAAAIADGWRSKRPDDELIFCPMADGGEGTLDAFELALSDTIRVPVTVEGPDGEPVHSYYLQLPDGTAVIELASTSGLTLLKSPAPMTAHTRGFGQAIAAALDAGATRVILGLGGSGSTDGGTGALRALGARLLDTDGRLVIEGGAGLSSIATIDPVDLRPIPAHGVIALSDVTSPLTGPTGAAVVFGPQKGASEEQVRSLDDGLGHLADLVGLDRTVSGAGSAGGVGYGMLSWGAVISPGAAAIADAVGLRRKVAGAALIVTGEGQFDSQSSEGKVISHVLEVARAAAVPSALIAGRITASTERFSFAESLSALAGSGAAAMQQPTHWINEAAARIARDFTTNSDW